MRKARVKLRRLAAQIMNQHRMKR